ncbi:hypothetical protein [uncultured Mitsuokella sp.]|uniref:hypothetical protein n=1 Tax=uncultured Mitsuokella sp. TaxID=453120 RepID=UPI002592B794|nr:hypothetical protein [uncultured Mitsuokella sp.]
MANVKTYKMEPETSEKLQKICEELNLTWDGTFQTLANLYMQQKAIGALPERGMEVKEFQSLLNRVSEAFTYALTVNADAEERIRQEFNKKFAEQQHALAKEEMRAETAAKAAKEKALEAEEQANQAKSLREEMEKLTRELGHVKEAARLAAKAQAEALADKERLNALQAQQLDNLKQEVKACRDEAAVAKEIRDKADGLQRSLASAEQAKKQAEKQVAELRAALEDREQQMKARTDALEAQYAQEKHMFLQKAENERQSAVLAVKAEYAARMESLQEKYMARLEASYGTKKEQAAAQKGGAGDAPEGAAGKESDRG